MERFALADNEMFLREFKHMNSYSTIDELVGLLNRVDESDNRAVDFIKKRGGKNIKFMSIIAAPEGLKALSEAHPDIQIYCGNLDRCLNENAYICPGLGDAGDRIFGTK